MSLFKASKPKVVLIGSLNQAKSRIHRRQNYNKLIMHFTQHFYPIYPVYLTGFC